MTATFTPDVRLDALLRRHRRALPAVGIVAGAIAAYWFTLASLADFLRLDTPLAYLLMLPLFSLLLAVVTVIRYQGLPPAPRIVLLDVLAGTALLVVALLAVTLLPAAWSTYYWVERPDVISLVLFVSGAVIICYGTTWFWRLRSSITFLLLMWPALYLHLLAGPMQSITDATNSALGLAAQVLPLGVSSGGGDVLTVPTGAGPQVSVVVSSACSGANGLLGFALMGSAMTLIFSGPRARKLLWLVCGLLLVFVLNVARIVSILGLARLGHPELALGGYHAVIGLVLFTAAILLMRLVAPRFGLRWTLTEPPAQRVVSAPAPPVRIRTLGRLAIAGGLVACTGLALLSEGGLSGYAGFVDGTGGPTVAAYTVRDALPPGWAATYVATYGWAQQYFGANSQFDRYALHHGNGTSAWLDVVRTDDQGALDAYNVQSCFLFHNYLLKSVQRIDIGNQITGLRIDYADPSTRTRWAAVSWALPILFGGTSEYERLTLTTSIGYAGGVQAPDPQPASGLRGMMLSLLNSFGGRADGSVAEYHDADQALQGVATAIAGAMVRGATI